jgi:nucleotide-binding universal stress UspA family protein
VRKLFLGSVADKVVRYAPCPVMLSGRSEDPAGRFRRILLPIDFSEASCPAVDAALGLARADGAEVYLLHVFHDVMPPSFYAAGDAFRWDPALRGRCQGAMDEFLSGRQAEGITIHKIAEEGKVSQVIVDVAQREGADLIVMGTQGRGDAPHILLGSTTERVLRRASCPVLAVPSGQP